METITKSKPQTPEEVLIVTAYSLYEQDLGEAALAWDALSAKVRVKYIMKADRIWRDINNIFKTKWEMCDNPLYEKPTSH